MATHFYCEICAEALTVDIKDPKTYNSLREEQNLLMGKLYIVRTSHEVTNDEVHFNVVVIDQDGQYRAHQDSYSEHKSIKTPEQLPVTTIKSELLTPEPPIIRPTTNVLTPVSAPLEPKTSKQIPVLKKGESLFLGRVALLGQGGSGKTRAIQEIANELVGKEQYSWSEEKNLAGTLTITPYSLKTSSGIQVIVNDNPGQSSLDLVRQSAAMSGTNYAGIILFTDACAWNFKQIGLQHARFISQYIRDPNPIPVLVITSKTDLRDILSSKKVIDHHSSLIADTVQDMMRGQKIIYFDRVNNQAKSFEIRQGREQSLYFTQLEQVIVNALQTDHRENEFPGFTQMNIRLYTRSLLLGFCDLVIQWMTDSRIPDIYPELNAFDENLINALNYFRPTAYETASTWEQFHGEGKNEPPLIKEAFDKNSIKAVIQEFVLGSKEKHDHFLNALGREGIEERWNIIGGVYTNSITKEGKNEMMKALEQLFYAVAGNKGHKELSFTDLGLDNF